MMKRAQTTSIAILSALLACGWYVAAQGAPQHSEFYNEIAYPADFYLPDMLNDAKKREVGRKNCRQAVEKEDAVCKKSQPVSTCAKLLTNSLRRCDIFFSKCYRGLSECLGVQNDSGFDPHKCYSKVNECVSKNW